ncbi:MAG: ABC-F family ATP-binding cassette domain-containing protein [Bdellovibrionales bacterium]|nr:ABC-F family ATP-binding cassette domain-containing protein [Bdellovibrionales bacterium]
MTSALVHLDSVTVQIGSRMLFEDLRLSIRPRSRIGIVGPNGSGKSTLLKTFAGIVEPNSGRVVSGGVRVVYVPQSEDFSPQQSVLQAAASCLEGHLSAEEVEVAASKALSRVGFVDFDQNAAQLSGGWQKRLSLAVAFAQAPEVLLLDEPTNHLDLDGLSWLEDTLRKANFAWALVSHDRFFLDHTVEQVVELSPFYPGGVFQSDGGYIDFKENRERFLSEEAKRTSALANKTRRELEWASRSPKARTGKAAFRMRQAKELQGALREAKSRKPKEQVKTNFRSGEVTAKELVELIKCSFSYGDKEIVSRLSFTFRNKTCLGLLGTNGQGKSTLLKLIGGELLPSSGKVKAVHGLNVVYFDQLRKSLSEWKTLGELLGEGQREVLYQDKLVHIVSWGKRFGFELADHEKLVSSLSGGEQARALLSVLVRQQADLLLLDEPTNDLDIPMLEALETMILEFEGAVVLVTHDRFMLDEVCTHFLGFVGQGELKEFASFEQWSDQSGKEEIEGSAPSREAKEKQKSPRKKLSYKDQLEFGRIEGTILKAEEHLSTIEAKIADPSTHSDPLESKKISEDLHQAKQEVDRLYARWEELDTLRREISGEE